MRADERARELAWVAENACALHGVRTRLIGRAPEGPAVFVANHVSYFDPLIIASYAPCAVIAKHEVAAWPCIGVLAASFPVLFVRRQDALSGARVLRACMRLLEEGVSVLVFPEGTTTRGDAVLPFRRGVFGAAVRAGVTVVPVALRYDSSHAAWVGDDSFVPHYLRTLAQPCTAASVEFLEPIAASRVADARAMADSAHSAIARALRVRPLRQASERARGDGRLAAAL